MLDIVGTSGAVVGLLLFVVRGCMNLEALQSTCGGRIVFLLLFGGLSESSGGV